MSTQSPFGNPSALPGIGLRSPHVLEILEHRPDIAWLEVHPENYMKNPAALAQLESIRGHYPLSLHGVSLSLGSATTVVQAHCSALKDLVDRLQPLWVSEHLSWSRSGDAHLNDLLPLPYTEEALDTLVTHVDRIQTLLGRPILIENPSSYLRYRHSTLGEATFLAELVRRTGCGVLLDVNNLYVSAHNVGLDVPQYFAALPKTAVGEIHVAGHATSRIGDATMLIDDHGSRVTEGVWSLYADAIRHYGYRPTLVEWDTDIPALDVLMGEAGRARAIAEDLQGAWHDAAR